MIIINEQETGLGKSFLKKIRIKDVSLKNAIKVTKFAAPIAAGFIPVGGGVASKLLSSKGGKLVSRVAKSKAVRKGVKLSKTTLGRKVVNAVQNRPRPQIEAVSTLAPASFATAIPSEQSQSSTYSETSENIVTDNQPVAKPVGELTPVKSVSYSKMANAGGDFQPTAINAQKLVDLEEPALQTAVSAPKKNNMLLYVLGAVVLGGGIYYATKKK
ncbi:hypothetical protein KHA90_11850 [Flavobacterium psychroterrae]|uniref:LPXTG cell wall anchor domain-containing protein n=1 Tax=Flavobacterium psychroterrae TaxID=2133767 RepID=A0ABS5PBN8_9FLAO|nr:hypothetical protein [Flavobacterium psychroterrae]MBS7231720.1 hypothetical protein [Flavobacterium psychroterrae]